MSGSRWLAFHLYYHADRDRALVELVAPAVRALLADGLADGFFFVRYGLGGPHLRLRLRCPPGAESRAETVLEAAARRFLACRPSRRPRDAEAIRRLNRELLTDPNESAGAGADEVVEDNTFRRAEFRPETERYGGAELLARSYEVFAFSSLAALRFLSVQAGAPRSRQLAAGAEVLLTQAWGLSAGWDGLTELLGYALSYWGGHLTPMERRADEVFAGNEERLVAWGRRLLEERAEPAAAEGSGLIAASRRLAHRLQRSADADGARVRTSHLHMTANRLGLSNPEEVYLSRLIGRVLDAAGERWPDLRRRAESSLGRLAAGVPAPAGRLREALLAGWPPPPPEPPAATAS